MLRPHRKPEWSVTSSPAIRKSRSRRWAASARCTMEPFQEFADRPHRVSEHKRRVPTGKHYAKSFRCHHLVLCLRRFGKLSRWSSAISWGRSGGRPRKFRAERAGPTWLGCWPRSGRSCRRKNSTNCPKARRGLTRRVRPTTPPHHKDDVPSSFGITFCLSPHTKEIQVTARWGHYDGSTADPDNADRRQEAGLEAVSARGCLGADPVRPGRLKWTPYREFPKVEVQGSSAAE